ncbi:MAG: DUF2339 domain-containing protein [Gemmatimonadales bacterium]
MTDEQRETIEQLERRVATLENIVRRLTFVAHTADRLQVTAPQPPARASVPASAPVVRTSMPSDLEQWFGQRGLLAIGVLALLTAAAFFLKYAFDRGWIPPLLRSLGAFVAGIGVAAWGHERIGHGMRRYGAALIGAGGGLAYLGLWAAAGPYALIDRRVGILLLAATTIAVTMLALHHELEGLAIWALSGAYLAPIVLVTAPNPMGFLGYLEVIGLGTGILAYTMGWRLTFSLALFGYIALAMSGAGEALGTPAGFWLIAAGGVLTLHVTYHRQWPEARVLILVLTWSAFGGGTANLVGPAAVRWLALGAVTAVFALLWVQQLWRPPFATGGRVPDALFAERFLFIANPIAILILANAMDIRLLERYPEAVPTALAVLYLAAAWQRRAASLLIMGFGLAALAIAFAWDGSLVAASWMVLALAALATETAGGRPGGRHAATALATLALICLFTSALLAREGTSFTHFTDEWARALYVVVAGTALAARWWGTDPGRPLWKRGGAEWMWILCGIAVFVGGSIELQGSFARIARLAGDLAWSVWWLVYAGVLVFIGFRLDRKLIRSAGLLVAALVGIKIVFYDLSTLQALYRVGSFFALAIIALAVAYAYNQKARASAA